MWSSLVYSSELGSLGVVEGPRVTVELVEEAVEVSVEVTLLRTGLS